MTTAPELCVIVLSYGNDGTIVAAVESLLTQDVDVEIVVSHSGGGQTPALLAPYAPAVRVVAAAQRRLPGAARNAGVAVTRAPYVAFLAGDCRALPGWAAGRLARHRAGAMAVACALVPLDRTAAALAAHLLQHGSRMPHLAMPGARFRYGLSYARPVLERYGPFPETLVLGEDSVVKRRLIAAGVAIVWAPDVLTAYAYPTAVPALLADQYRRGRLRAAHCNSLARRSELLLQVLLHAPAALWQATRPGSSVRPRQFAQVAPLVCAGALVTIGGVLRGGPRTES